MIDFRRQNLTSRQILTSNVCKGYHNQAATFTSSRNKNTQPLLKINTFYENLHMYKIFRVFMPTAGNILNFW